MATKDTNKNQDYIVLIEAIKTVNKSVDKLSVKLDGVATIAMSMSNEIARLDERVTFALEQQKEHASDIAYLKSRLVKLESYDAADSRIKNITTKIFLICLSALVTGLLMYITNNP